MNIRIDGGIALTNSECINNTFIIVLVYEKSKDIEGEKSYLANCEKPDDFYCFALIMNSFMFLFKVLMIEILKTCFKFKSLSLY